MYKGCESLYSHAHKCLNYYLISMLLSYNQVWAATEISIFTFIPWLDERKQPVLQVMICTFKLQTRCQSQLTN